MNDAERTTEQMHRHERLRFGDAGALEPEDESLENISRRLTGAPPLRDICPHRNTPFIQKFLRRFSPELNRIAESKIIEAEVISMEPGRPVMLDLSSGHGVLDSAEPVPADIAVRRRYSVSPVDIHVKKPAAGTPIICSLQMARGRRSLSRIESIGSGGGLPIEGVVVEQVGDEGWIVDVDGVKAALPSSEAGDVPIALNATVRFVVIDYDYLTYCVILSRSKWVSHEREIMYRRASRRLTAGDVHKARVVAISATHASLIVNGIPAEMAAADAGYGSPRDNLGAIQVGQVMDVFVMEVTPDHVKVGTRQLHPDPWVFVKKVLVPGNRMPAVVHTILADRVKMELREDVFGEIPWKEAGWQIEDASELEMYFRIGETIEVVCLSVQKESQRAILSLKATQPDPLPEIQRRYLPGQRCEVRLVSYNNARARVMTEDGYYGFILPEDLTWSGPSSPMQFFAGTPTVVNRGPGAARRLTVEILSVDLTTRLIRFGFKQSKPDPFLALVQEIEVGKIYEGSVVKIIPAGVLVEVRKGLVGMLRKIDCVSSEAVPAEGQTIRVMVMNIQPQLRRITLSRQAVVDAEERREMQPFLSSPPEERKVRMKDMLAGDVFRKFFEDKKGQSGPPA